MKKQVRETNAGQQISVYVVLNKKGHKVAMVHAHHGSTCRVDVYTDCDSALEKNAKILGLDDPMDAIVQQGSASGGGYDKFTAALAGLVIDGVVMYDHCGRSPESERLLKRYHKAVGQPGFLQRGWDAKAHRIGASFANLTRSTPEGRKYFSSLHMDSGLDRLTRLGYRVIQAI